MNITKAAREVIRSVLEREPLCASPYEAIWRHTNESLFVHGPCIELDWIEGKPRSERDQVLCISFDDEACILHVYTLFTSLFRLPALQGTQLRFEYADPDFPRLVLDAAKRIIGHHGILVEEHRDDYREWVSELKRGGKWNLGIPDIEDVPWGRYPNGVRKFRH